MFRTCTVVLMLLSSPLLATPVNYLESVGGDLPGGGVLQPFTFDVGLNTISGNVGVKDADDFAFTVPAGMTVTSAVAELTDAQTGPGDIIYGEWVLRTGNVYTGAPYLQQFRVPSPGSASISVPADPGTYSIWQASLEFYDTGDTPTSNYTFSFTVVPEPASLVLVPMIALVLRRRR